jgi:hypothetical protein
MSSAAAGSPPGNCGVAVLLQDLINALPTGPLHKGTVDEDECYFRRLRYSSHDDFLSFIW